MDTILILDRLIVRKIFMSERILPLMAVITGIQEATVNKLPLRVKIHSSPRLNAFFEKTKIGGRLFK